MLTLIIRSQLNSYNAKSITCTCKEDHCNLRSNFSSCARMPEQNSRDSNPAFCDAYFSLANGRCLF